VRIEIERSLNWLAMKAISIMAFPQRVGTGKHRAYMVPGLWLISGQACTPFLVDIINVMGHGDGD